jgi:hypothetical protein
MYNHLKQTVDAFEITLGINKGYGHNNECVTDFEADYQAIATAIYKQTDVYVSSVIIPAKVVYNVDWGCPTDGENVYVIKGVNNTQFVKPADYKEAVMLLIEKLATTFEQSTVTTTWSTVKMVYTTKKGEL